MRIRQDSFSFQITETAEMSVRNKFKILFLFNFFYNVVAIKLIMSSSTTSYDGECFSIPVLNLHLNFKCWFLCFTLFLDFSELLFHISACFFFLSLLVRFVCFFYDRVLFHQRCASTSFSNTNESFWVPRSWTNNLSCRN